MHSPRIALHDANCKREWAYNQAEQRSEPIFGASLAADLKMAELKACGQLRSEELIQMGGNAAYGSSRRTEQQNMWT
jgi:hypothetical protein